MTSCPLQVAVAPPAAHAAGGERLWRIDCIDEREAHGRLSVDIGADDGNLDSFLAVDAVIATDPRDGAEVPSLGIRFGDTDLAFTCFKKHDAILLTLDEGVRLTPVTLPDGKIAYLVE